MILFFFVFFCKLSNIYDWLIDLELYYDFMYCITVLLFYVLAI